jgi:hypothetical protein
MNARHRSLAHAAAVLALLLPGSLAFAGVALITVGLPLGGTVIPFEGSGQKVVFSSTVFLGDPPSVPADWKLVGGPWIRLTICTKGGGKIERYPAPGKLPLIHEEIPIEELIALIPGKYTEKQQFEWTILVGAQSYKDLSGYSPSEYRQEKGHALSSLTQEFMLAAPPDLAVHVDADFGSPWPKTAVVRNVGGSKSQPSSLEITFRLRDASDPAARNRCAPIDFHQVHTLLGLAPNDRKSFDVPKPPGAAPAAKPAGVHKVVTCNYTFDALLSKDTNKADPNAANDSVHKIVSVDVPLN